MSFTLDTDWKLGFAGRNGKGKTTFLRLLQGKYPYQGTISASVAFDYFPYPAARKDKERTGLRTLEEWKSGCEEWRVIVVAFEARPGCRGFVPAFGTLSQGEQTKVMLPSLFPENRNFSWWMSHQPSGSGGKRDSENIPERKERVHPGLA